MELSHPFTLPHILGAIEIKATEPIAFTPTETHTLFLSARDAFLYLFQKWRCAATAVLAVQLQELQAMVSEDEPESECAFVVSDSGDER